MPNTETTFGLLNIYLIGIAINTNNSNDPPSKYPVNLNNDVNVVLLTF